MSAVFFPHVIQLLLSAPTPNGMGAQGWVGQGACDAAGWCATGDLVSIRDGYLTVEGRIKDIILRGGENITDKEVKNQHNDHTKNAKEKIKAKKKS